MMGFGFLGMLLFWGALLSLIAGGVALVYRQATGIQASSKQGRPTARQILDERLASGEISRRSTTRFVLALSREERTEL